MTQGWNEERISVLFCGSLLAGACCAILCFFQVAVSAALGAQQA